MNAMSAEYSWSTVGRHKATTPHQRAPRLQPRRACNAPLLASLCRNRPPSWCERALRADKEVDQVVTGRDGHVSAARARFSHLARTNRRIATWISALRRPLYTSSLYLTATSLVNAGSGFVFWVVAARLFTPEEVGAGAALISAAGFLLWVSSLGLEAAIIKYLPQTCSDSSALTNSYLTVASLAGGVAAVAFLATLPLWSPALAFIRHSPLSVLVFLGVVVAGANAVLVDYTFVVLRRSQLTFARTLTQALLKLLLLLALATVLGQALGIFMAWGLAMVLSVVVALWLFLPKALPGYRPRPIVGRHISGEMARFSITNYLRGGLSNATVSLIPIIVVNVLGARANAYSYVGWGAAAPLLAIPDAVAVSLFAEGAHKDESLALHVKRSLKMAFFLLLPAVVTILVVGDKLLLLFGQDYSQQTTSVLRVVAASAIPATVMAIYLGIAQVQHRLKPLVLVPAARAVGTLALSYALTRPLGILGPATAWLVMESALALAVLPGIVKVLRSDHDAPVRLDISGTEVIGRCNDPG
jgi:O-antigen/teichoic acid export membrane protein